MYLVHDFQSYYIVLLSRAFFLLIRRIVYNFNLFSYLNDGSRLVVYHHVAQKKERYKLYNNNNNKLHLAHDLLLLLYSTANV